MDRQCELCGTTDSRYSYINIQPDRYASKTWYCNRCAHRIVNSWWDYMEEKYNTIVCPNCGGDGYVHEYNGPYYKLKSNMLQHVKKAAQELEEARKNLEKDKSGTTGSPPYS